MPTMLRNLKGKPRNDYQKWVDRFALGPIESEEDFDAATGVLAEMMDNGNPTVGEKLYFSALYKFVKDYDDEHYPVGQSTDADMLAHLLEARELSQAELARETGIAKSTISSVLKGDRTLSREAVGTLANYFGVSSDLFGGAG